MQVAEVRLARYQAGLASAQSRSVMISFNIRIRWPLNFIGTTLTHLYNIIHTYINKVINGILETKKSSSKRNKIKGFRQRKRKRRLEKARTQDEDLDFWGVYRERREKDYKMPSQNRKNRAGIKGRCRCNVMQRSQRAREPLENVTREREDMGLAK